MTSRQLKLRFRRPEQPPHLVRWPMTYTRPYCVLGICRRRPSSRARMSARAFNLNGIDWVIVGGESGPGARPMASGWVTDIRDQCIAAEMPFFFKQWGGVNKGRTGRQLEGRTWDEMPDGQEIARSARVELTMV